MTLVPYFETISSLRIALFLLVVAALAVFLPATRTTSG